jgi:hypothetical protein
VDEEPKRIDLQYHKPDPVFPTKPGDQIVFWGCLTVLMFVFAIAGILGALVLWHY